MEDFLFETVISVFYSINEKKRLILKVLIKKTIGQVSKMVYNRSFCLSYILLSFSLYYLSMIHKSWKNIFIFTFYVSLFQITYKMCYTHILHNDIYQNQRRNNNKKFFNIDIKLGIQNSLVFSILQQSTTIVSGYFDLLT